MIEFYEKRLESARSRFNDSDALSKVMSPNGDKELLQLFLINYCSYGVGMTEPVESWIKRAGERCVALGLEELGRALKSHAKGEANHHLMMIDDTKALVSSWNARHPGSVLDADKLFARPMLPGVARYQKLHEDIIAGPTPYGQIGVEYEIERLSVTHGGKMIQSCVQTLGPELLANLSFLSDHVEIDVGHTEFNRRQLVKILATHPDFLDAIVDAGVKALDAYAEFIQDCWADAQKLLKHRLKVQAKSL